jgi:hypothetical protein
MGSPTDGADWVVTTSHCNLPKKLYSVACSDRVISGFNKGRENLFYFATVLDSLLHTLFLYLPVRVILFLTYGFVGFWFF